MIRTLLHLKNTHINKANEINNTLKDYAIDKLINKRNEHFEKISKINDQLREFYNFDPTPNQVNKLDSLFKLQFKDNNFINPAIKDLSK